MNNIKTIKSFTLIETIIAITVFALLMGAMAGAIVMLYKVYGYTWEQSVAINEARQGVETMVKDIRGAKTGDNGSYPIEIADDKQFVFYGDTDADGKTERVRYFLGTINSKTQIQECSTAVGGGTCSVNFSNFLSGTLKSAQVRVSVDGDLDAANEYVAIYIDGNDVGDLCISSCLHCASDWQGTTVFDVTTAANDDSITFLADASSRVGRECPAGNPNHAMKARFEFSWTEEVISIGNELKKGVIEPIGTPVEYPSDQEKISTITPYIRNNPPIFEYFDADGNKITQLPARLSDTKLMKVYLVINVDPNRPPDDFELESSVQLRNLKEE